MMISLTDTATSATSASPVVATSDTPVLLAIDGNSLAHRAYHAYAARGTELTDSQGRPRSAVYGFLTLAIGCAHKVVERFGRIDGIVVGFDDPHGSQRRVEFPPYKATRSAKDESLVMQLKEIPNLLSELGIQTIVEDLWEADDVLGSASRCAEDAGWRCVVATSDRDACALVSPSTSMFRLTGGLDKSQWLDEAGVLDHFGVSPQRYVLYSATRGDVSDNLDGVPGLGPKRAAALWSECATIAEALANADLVKLVGKRGAQSLADSVSVLERNLSIMEIRRDIDVDITLCAPPSDVAAMTSVLVAWELPGLVARTQGLVELFNPSLSSDFSSDFDHEDMPEDAPVGHASEFSGGDASGDVIPASFNLGAPGKRRPAKGARPDQPSLFG